MGAIPQNKLLGTGRAGLNCLNQGHGNQYTVPIEPPGLGLQVPTSRRNHPCGRYPCHLQTDSRDCRLGMAAESRVKYSIEQASGTYQQPCEK